MAGTADAQAAAIAFGAGATAATTAAAAAAAFGAGATAATTAAAAAASFEAASAAAKLLLRLDIMMMEECAR